MHSNTGLTSVFHSRTEPCKLGRGPRKKGCTTLNIAPFTPWRNGRKPPERMKLRLHQVVEQSTGWVFVERMVGEIVLGL